MIQVLAMMKRVEGMAGEYEADDGEDQEDIAAANEHDMSDGIGGDEYSGQHNESTAQADAGGGSSGSGS